MMSTFDYVGYLSEFWSRQRELSEFEQLLHVLGDPHKGLRCIHVAGTNGKGSTCAFIESILREDGYLTGLYTSPALVYPHERIRVGGQMTPENWLSEAAKLVYRAEQSLGIKYGGFDRMTAAAFIIFKMAGVQFAILETGLGGRLDATNVCESEIAVVTSIGMDHMNLLGGTFESIANEKCGIIKSCQKCVIAHPQKPDVMEIIKNRCSENGVKLIRVDSSELMLEGIVNMIQKFRMQVPEGATYFLKTSMLGEHQLTNAASAVLVARTLGIDAIKISEGIKKAMWPGRMELLVDDQPNVLLDGAHNPQAVDILMRGLNAYFPNKRFILITAFMRDKDYESMIEQFANNRFEHLIALRIGDRSIEPEVIAQIAITQGINAVVEQSVESAFNAAEAYCDNENKEDFLIVVAGSLYLIGAARRYLLSEEYDVS